MHPLYPWLRTSPTGASNSSRISQFRASSPLKTPKPILARKVPCRLPVVGSNTCHLTDPIGRGMFKTTPTNGARTAHHTAAVNVNTGCVAFEPRRSFVYTWTLNPRYRTTPSSSPSSSVRDSPRGRTCSKMRSASNSFMAGRKLRVESLPDCSKTLWERSTR